MVADPTVTLLTSGNGTTATTTVSFSAQTAGTLMVLVYGGDDYRTTSGAGRPESTGWTLISDQHTFLGHAAWYKLSAGSETSVQYTIGSASPSCYQLITADNIDQTTPLDIANGQFQQTSSNNYTTPSVTTTSGRRWGLAMMGATSSTAAFTASGTWLNSYVNIGSAFQSTAATRDVISSASRAFDGGGSESSGCTFSQVAQSKTGIIAVFKVASGAAPTPPILVMPTRRAF